MPKLTVSERLDVFFWETRSAEKKGAPFNTFVTVALWSKTIQNKRDKWACQVKIITIILMHTTYFKGIRDTTQFHVSQLTWYSSYWNKSINKESGGGKKRPGEHQLGKQNLPLHLTLIAVTV